MKECENVLKMEINDRRSMYVKFSFFTQLCFLVYCIISFDCILMISIDIHARYYRESVYPEL